MTFGGFQFSAGLSRRRHPAASSSQVPGGAAGVVPSSPTFVQVSGSTSGAKTVTADAPQTRFDGSAISIDPVTSYTARAYQISAGVIGALRGTASGSSLPLTITGLPAQDMVALVTATNSVGDSEESLPSAAWTGT